MCFTLFILLILLYDQILITLDMSQKTQNNQKLLAPELVLN